MAKKQTRQKKILIVEDEHPIATTLNLKLESHGYAIVQVANGTEALHALKKDTIDLILLDLVMPEMDGFSVLAELKKQNNRTPIIVLTNLGQDDDAKRCKDLGAHDYFIKADTPLVDIVDRIAHFLS